jgi:hypothetical protein
MLKLVVEWFKESFEGSTKKEQKGLRQKEPA